MASVAIVYSTVDGQTRRIGERLAEVLAGLGHEVALRSITRLEGLELPAFDKVVVGASIRYGRHRPQVAEFVHAHRGLLDTRPSAFFSVNIVARKPQKNRPDTNPYVRRFLREAGWQPRLADVFAGRLDLPRCGWLDRTVIRFIMLLTGGPTAADTVVEYTDWARVDEFAHRLAAL